jgi:hypothetical protein
MAEVLHYNNSVPATGVAENLKNRVGINFQPLQIKNMKKLNKAQTTGINGGGRQLN